MGKGAVVYSSSGTLQRNWKGMNHNTQRHRWISQMWCWGKEVWHRRVLIAWVNGKVQKQAKAIHDVRSKDGGYPWGGALKRNRHEVSFWRADHVHGLIGMLLTKIYSLCENSGSSTLTICALFYMYAILWKICLLLKEQHSNNF